LRHLTDVVGAEREVDERVVAVGVGDGGRLAGIEDAVVKGSTGMPAAARSSFHSPHTA
jgi:hypothetical protein